MWGRGLIGPLLLIFSQPSLALQTEGLSSFGALRLPIDAGVAALGDYNVSHTGGCVSLVWQNPALLTAGGGLQTAISFLDYYADIRAAGNMWSMQVGTHGFGVGLRYLSYGELQGYDLRGVQRDNFSATRQLLLLAYGHRIGPFAVGVSLLPAHVAVDYADAYGLFLDMGATFTHPRQALRIGLVLKHVPLLSNHGFSHPYAFNPLDIWLGMSYRPAAAPFRFSLTLYDLTHKTYYYDSDSPVAAHREAGSFFSRVLGKCNFGTELLVGKVLCVQSAFTVARRQQFKTNEFSGLAGFSFGFALQLRAFVLQATRSFHQVRSGRTHLGLQINFDALWVKREKTISK